MRLLLKIAAGLLVVYLALLGGLLFIMRRPATFSAVMKHVPDPAFMVIPFKHLWFIARAGNLKVGDPAPDFTLQTGDKKSMVELASFRGREPVVLIFGSYT